MALPAEIPLAALTVQGLADALGDIDAVVEPLLVRRTALRSEATRRRLNRLIGQRWRVERAVTTPLVADVPAIEARMGATWLKAFLKRQPRVAFTITSLAVPEDAA